MFNDFRIQLEELDIPSEKAEEIIIAAGEMNKAAPADNGAKIEDKVEIIRQELRQEMDWRKRASLAAKIISLRLESE